MSLAFICCGDVPTNLPFLGEGFVRTSVVTLASFKAVPRVVLSSSKLNAQS